MISFFLYDMRSRANSQTLLVWCRGYWSRDSQLVPIYLFCLLICSPSLLNQWPFLLWMDVPVPPCDSPIVSIIWILNPFCFKKADFWNGYFYRVSIYFVWEWLGVIWEHLCVSLRSLSEFLSLVLSHLHSTQVSYIMAWGIGAFFVGYGQIITLYMWGSCWVPLYFVIRMFHWVHPVQYASLSVVMYCWTGCPIFVCTLNVRMIWMVANLPFSVFLPFVFFTEGQVKPWNTKGNW